MYYACSCRPLPGLRNQLPAGLRAGAVRRLLQQLRHPGSAARRGRVRRRPLRPGLPRQVLHYLQLLPPLFHEWFITVVLSAVISVFHRLRLQMYVHE